MDDSKIRVAIFEDHQGIVDGYLYRLSTAPNMMVVGNVMWGSELEPFLDRQPVDVLIMDLNVPTSDENRNPFPILYALPAILQKHPSIRILVISVSVQSALIEALMNLGVRGYIYKDDTGSIQKLSQIVDAIAGGGNYFSEGIFQKLQGRKPGLLPIKLTVQQQRVLSFCIINPDIRTEEIASMLCVAQSTVRNTLSEIYTRLGVHTRAAAIAKAQTLGLLGDMDFGELAADGSVKIEESPKTEL